MHKGTFCAIVLPAIYIERTVELMVFIISLASCVSRFCQTITIAGILDI